MSVTRPKGFLAAGTHSGIKKDDKLDLAVVLNEGPANVAAAVFTSNEATAHPVRWSKRALEQTGGEARGVVLNSGTANCFTGPKGEEVTTQTAQLAAKTLDVEPSQVIVCSTGIIGHGAAKLGAAVNENLEALIEDASEGGGRRAAEAIMTTDTRPKEAEYVSDAGWSIGGMAKGAGMLAPGLATMLVVLTTDADLTAPQAGAALKEAVSGTFNRLDTDGCMSTNDQVTLLASGASEVRPDPAEFSRGLYDVCLDLAMQLQDDAEGASHTVAIEVSGAPSDEEAEKVARSISRSNLFKTAVFGNDPNWGRIMSAAGAAGVSFEADETEIWINGVRLCAGGGPDEPIDLVDMTPRNVDVEVVMSEGAGTATVWTTDLTYDYVHENSAYTS